ncbi:hypothetical protein MKW94_022832 [Papaver nudicaule]|uniref:L-ascorbate oxidase n=1 Tax=Papaver nudicaule TaxID=74823 RepID=A0AA41SGD8_PAPNU|nr:hypothetical protein [Papaver nudicaule]
MGSLFLLVSTAFFLIPLILQTCFMVSGEVKCSDQKVKCYDWNVEYMYWKPDCVESLVMGINGNFPGPTITAKAGDTILVNLTNKLHTEGVVIHWHGIRQLETPWADGTAAISQCAINPGDTFLYNFTVDKAGTYFYHGHYGMQRSAGLYGSLNVDVADGSILINGKGQFGCSLGGEFITKCSQDIDEQCQPEVFNIQPKKKYRVRIASTTSLASLSFSIGHHTMTLVEADGNYVQQVEVDSLNIYSGDTYSVLIETNQDPSTNYWISAYQIARKPPLPLRPGLTILNYKTNPVLDAPSSSPLPSTPPVWNDFTGGKSLTPLPTPPVWNDFTGGKSFANKILALQSDQLTIPKPPTSFDRRIVLLNTQNNNNGYIRWSINNVSLVLPTTPLLGSLKYGLQNGLDSEKPDEDFPSNYDITKPPVNPNSKYGSSVYKFDYGITIDVIIQNANVLKPDTSEVHPWHLHGHDFWVLGYGEGRFSSDDESSNLNLKNPPLRNNVVVFPHGWTAIRFVTDNPGVWPFHCHIEPHLHMGMGVVFAEAVNRIKRVPSGVLECGLTAKTILEDSITSSDPLGAPSPSPSPGGVPRLGPMWAVNLVFIYLVYVGYMFVN